MRVDTEYTRDALAAQHEFEVHVNAFLNRNVYLAYVYPDGTVDFGGEDALARLYGMATAQFGRGNVSAGSVNDDIFKDRDEIIHALQSQYERAADERKEVYVEAVRRYLAQPPEAHYYKKSTKHDWSKTYWWYIKNRQDSSAWGHTDKINNIGDIAEGYVDTVVNEDTNVNNSHLEESLESLWAHIRRNNTPAIIREDVSLKNSKGDIQFAVKSGSFSTASIGQYYRFAQNIVKLKFLTAKDLENNDVFKALISNNTKTTQVRERLNEIYAQKIINDFNSNK